jgi:hypothetical protein
MCRGNIIKTEREGRGGVPGVAIKRLGDLVNQTLDYPLNRHYRNILRCCHLLIFISSSNHTLKGIAKGRGGRGGEGGEEEDIHGQERDRSLSLRILVSARSFALNRLLLLVTLFPSDSNTRLAHSEERGKGRRIRRDGKNGGKERANRNTMKSSAPITFTFNPDNMSCFGIVLQIH